MFEGRVCFPPTQGLYSKARWEKYSELPFFMLLPSSLFARKILYGGWGIKVREGKSSISIVRLIIAKHILEARVPKAAGELFTLQWKEKEDSKSDSGECPLAPPTMLT